LLQRLFAVLPIERQSAVIQNIKHAVAVINLVSAYKSSRMGLSLVVLVKRELQRGGDVESDGGGSGPGRLVFSSNLVEELIYSKMGRQAFHTTLPSHSATASISHVAGIICL
jgi:hypothetical protein